MADTSRKARVIAFYLPQYHPIPENDEWWGKGFTEWTNTAKAKPLFKGHYQPHVPADLGFYDLRLPEARKAQAELAKQYGIEAFSYYHYWFGGKRIIERPFEEVLQSGQPDFPFCLCWANQTWTGVWHGAPNRVLIEQTYPGMEDHRQHFEYLLKAFRDPRYLTVDGKPVFIVYNPKELPDSLAVTSFWRELAAEVGLPGLFLIAEHSSPEWDPRQLGFDASVCVRLPSRRRDTRPPPFRRNPLQHLKFHYQNARTLPTVHQYRDLLHEIVAKPTPGIESFPCVIPNWDNTPRSGANGMVLHGSTPSLFRQLMNKAIAYVQDRPEQHRIVFIKSWNEWAEGNHLEPDLRFGRQYLDALTEALQVRDAES